MTWINRFANLGPTFTTEVLPSPVPEPYWVAQNQTLMRAAGFPEAWLNSEEALSVFSGNGLWEGMLPRASVYSGHQFGHWAGQLGDGRALGLGEFQTAEGSFEVQLKGAGKTPFSRMGDGRAVLRSSIREYLCSEAMAGLGIPTTRALCLTGSKLPVVREELETAAIVTRIAPSFIRFGHFEHFANQSNDRGALKQLADFTLETYFSSLETSLGNPYADLLHQVSLKTAELVALWQSVGFCHGVLNTDNMSIVGLTLDYGAENGVSRTPEVRAALLRAGEQLHITPQTLSAQIKLLEESLGCQLFRKTGRNVELTAEGRTALVYADQIFVLGGDKVAHALGLTHFQLAQFGQGSLDAPAVA